MNVALHAPDTVPVDRGALARGPRIALHPSVTLLQSPWPIAAIGYTASLKAAAAEALALDTGIDLAAHIVELLDEEVVVARS